jgi:hypothetical protein
MRWLPLLILPLLCASANASSQNKKPKVSVRLYSEANAMDTEKFSTPVTLRYPPRKAFLNKIPHVSEFDIVAVYPFRAPDGSMGCAFKLNTHGALALDAMSTENRGKSAVIQVNGRQVIDLVIDKRITDGILTIPFGLTESEIGAILKAWPPKKKKFHRGS